MTARIRGVLYDAGTVFGRGQRPTRRHLDERVMRRELEVIRDELHATHVRVVASDPGRLGTVATGVAEAGLGLWYSPAVFDCDPVETTRRTVAMAGHAEALRRRHGGQVTFVAGSESTLFVRGLVPGRRLTDRFARIKADPSLLGSGDLARYLTALAAELRPVFGGPLTYASLSFEQPDWRSFDIVGVDHYRDDRVKDRYLEMLEPHLATGLPVVASEVGMRTYAGASASGALGFGITDITSFVLHQLFGRRVRVRNKPGYVRDEAGQAGELDETLSILEGSAVAGWFLASFSAPDTCYDDDPRSDRDMDGMSLVKGLPDGMESQRWPGERYDAKAAFDVVARHYAKP
ncbi:MAG TPA: hypothetical protein VMD59_22260 [Acidimicrobiales bacterium]|nr:hypothetical protein [Acidimicrobiales bacterium]